MLKSMTAYGRGEIKLDDTVFIAEIQSVNNRYRDIVLRVPKMFKILEKEIRAFISSRVRRGRIEVSIQMENNAEQSPYDVKLNAPLINSYLKVFNQLSEQFGIENDVGVETLCRMNDVIQLKQEPVDIEKIKRGFLDVLKEALDSLDTMRIREGEAIEADFIKRLDLLKGYVEEVDGRAPRLVEEYRMRLENNIKRMMQDEIADEGRLAQEVALFADKSDITEEIVRLRSHLGQFAEYLSSDEAIGRRLDFLLQEMNREVNTIGSKASDSLISRTVVEVKSELEKLREQVQNVE